VLALSIVLARGGLQMKPLKYSDAFALNSPFLGQTRPERALHHHENLLQHEGKQGDEGMGEAFCSQEEAFQEGRRMIVDLQRENIPDPKYPLHALLLWGGRIQAPECGDLHYGELVQQICGCVRRRGRCHAFFSRLSKDGFLQEFFCQCPEVH